MSYEAREIRLGYALNGQGSSAHKSSTYSKYRMATIPEGRYLHLIRSLKRHRPLRVHGQGPTSIGTRTGTYYVGRDRVYLAAPPHANTGAALLVFEAQD
jgi:hypothetical protein